MAAWKHQSLAKLLDRDSSSDALFLHTPNSNQNNFPLKTKGLSEESNLTNLELEKYVRNLNGYRIFYGQAEENFCVIFKDKVGIGLVV